MITAVITKNDGLSEKMSFLDWAGYATWLEANADSYIAAEASEGKDETLSNFTKVETGLTCCLTYGCSTCPYKESESCKYHLKYEASICVGVLRRLYEEIAELKSANGTATQEEVCRFLLNYVGVVKNDLLKGEA